MGKSVEKFQIWLRSKKTSKSLYEDLRSFIVDKSTKYFVARQ